jgi:hypothetical protein
MEGVCGRRLVENNIFVVNGGMAVELAGEGFVRQEKQVY